MDSSYGGGGGRFLKPVSVMDSLFIILLYTQHWITGTHADCLALLLVSFFFFLFFANNHALVLMASTLIKWWQSGTPVGNILPWETLEHSNGSPLQLLAAGLSAVIQDSSALGAKQRSLGDFSQESWMSPFARACTRILLSSLCSFCVHA